jgi:Asp-tRNA(Asn)/Glu-tRNA(Gln) amidotransferase A subunit family amidase
VENIANGRWTATQVLEAYIARAAEAHHHTNCLTEVMFATARAHAKALDDQFVVTGRVVGPLHGVPMSFKDQCKCRCISDGKGFPSMSLSRPSGWV